MSSKKSLRAWMRKRFLAGLAIGAPAGLTAWLAWSAVMTIDGWVLPLIPRRTLPDENILRDVPGIGVAIFLIATILLGMVAHGLLGRQIIRLGEAILARLPVVSSIYGGLRQIIDTVLGQDGPKFQRACLIEYPRRGLWAVAFVSTDARGEVARHTADGQRILSLFLPTTPNPTSGFLLFVPEADVTYLDMAVDEAIKLVISAGLVTPQDLGARISEPAVAPDVLDTTPSR